MLELSTDSESDSWKLVTELFFLKFGLGAVMCSILFTFTSSDGACTTCLMFDMESKRIKLWLWHTECGASGSR